MISLSAGRSGALFSKAEDDQLRKLNLLFDFPKYSTESTSSHSVFLWIHELARLNRLIPPVVQGHQDCVSIAWAQAVQDFLTVNSTGKEIPRVSSEVIYGGSRVLVGARKLQVPGCYSSWAARFVTLYGSVLREKIESFDLSNYNLTLVKQFENEGIPESVRTKLRPLEMLTPDIVLPLTCKVGKLTSFEHVWSAVGSSKPVPFACKRGFAMQRGPEGICDPAGEWDHSMIVRGRCVTSSGKRCVAVQNSIGEYLGTVNEVVPLMEGGSFKLPPCVFLVSESVFAEICEKEDVFVLF